jgi:hypothetical protein
VISQFSVGHSTWSMISGEVGLNSVSFAPSPGASGNQQHRWWLIMNAGNTRPANAQTLGELKSAQGRAPSFSITSHGGRLDTRGR